MSDTLQGLLLSYIRENNPELLLQLTKDDGLHQWVCEKIQEVEMVLNDAKTVDLSETAFLNIFTNDLQPSRFRYVRDLFETEFTDRYERMLEAGTLNYELINIVGSCHGLFEDIPLIEGMENPQLDHAVAQVINEYLENIDYE